MRNQLVYDLPLRIFHWLFAGLFILAFGITQIADDESAVFSYHMLAGLLLVSIVLLRLVWGVVGAKSSRFSSFALRPRELKSYFTGILSGDKRKWAGHNPASSWAALTMFALALGLGMTGYLMSTGGGELIKDVHELMANGFLIVALMHIAGVALHEIRHGDGIQLAMIDGLKSGVPQGEVIPSARPVVAFVFVGLVAVFSGYLLRHYDSQRRTLNLFGSTLQLGENEAGESGGGHGGNDDHDDDDRGD